MHRVEHIETLIDDDLPRFAALGVAASMQPLHMEGLDETGADAWSTAWRRAAERGFRSRDIARTRRVLALGSDWMVADSTRASAWAGRACGARRGAGRTPYLPEQALSPAGRSPATRPARPRHRRRRPRRPTGPVARDITVLGANPLEVPPDELPDVPVRLTVVDGAIVHRADAEPRMVGRR